ncbi:glutamyl aminopeptidase [Caerostris extrusa]|uniref:Glutamyl aminopeptidase n=1 Tax=Caerostris extrusa TaxID=172846 RepID=A0AAV4QQT0_CAEEX|nr:glutamyl aminopeptidase [Caerostris extrusa]
MLTRFERSPPMSTYLLGVVVCDFPFSEVLTETGVKVRLYAAPHRLEKGGYALDIATRILSFYEKYFGIPYPLKKLDLVSIPDMTYDGMENWGIITFRDEDLMYDNTSSLAKKYKVAILIAHELAHMWFGDLVTMEWWDDVWLNEGFATYMSWKGAKFVEPDIDKENGLGLGRLIDAMTADRSIHSHPIVRRVDKVGFEIYDDIAYAKGASVLRMLENYMGDDFREGIFAYLTKHSFGNAKTQDLWNALTAASKQGMDVGRMMDTWTGQMNYPYISVECPLADICAVQQHRYLEDPDTAQLSTQPTSYDYVWHIPMTYRTSNEKEISYLLLNDSEKEYIRSLSKDLYKQLGWNNTGDYSERWVRKAVILAACESSNQECQEAAAQMFKQWLSPDTRQLVYWYGAKAFGSSDQLWTLMWNRYQREDDPHKQYLLMDALTTLRNATLLERLVRLARNESVVRKHDSLAVMKRIAQNPKGFPIITHMIFTQWDQLVRTYGSGETEEFAAKVFQGFTTEKDLLKVREFYQRQKGRSRQGARAHTQALYSISLNINWLRRHRRTVREWLLSHVYMPWRDIRLPAHVLPVYYDLLLKPNISSQTFEGEELIRVNITKAADYLLFHEGGLQIRNIQLVGDEQKEDVPIAEKFSYKRNEYFVILFKEKVPPGDYLLRVVFSGKFSVNGNGMDRYQYTHRNTGEIRYLLATRFEATYARKVFPCFDEPSFKAKFKLSIVHPANLTAVSNMPEEEKVDLDGDLAKTMFMEPTYNGKPVRAYAPPDRLEEAAHGLNMTLRLLSTLEEFFDVPYVLPKLDSVCIPGYVVPGMEHWGAISYSGDRFLVNGSLPERSRILHVDRVIAHEVVHQWFGNLVTMEWWDDLWLNEGMSTLIMYIPLKQYFPSINEVDVRKMSRMMCPDSSVNSHPIVRNVSTPGEIEASFNVISYEKVRISLLICRLQCAHKDGVTNYGGKGLSNYLKKYAYRNARTSDLWSELDNASTMEVNVSGVMDTWTRQMGFPYVELSREGSSLTATQHWFSRNVNETKAEKVTLNQKYGFIWQIPLTFKNLATGNEHTLWLKDKTATFEINALKDDVVKFNPGFIGFYVVKYDFSDWEKLERTLLENHEALDVTDRYNLLHDAFVLSETDRLPYSIPLSLTMYLRREKDPLPWNLFRDHVLHFEHSLDQNSPTLALLKKYLIDLTSDLYDEYVASASNKSIFRKWDTKTGSCSFSYSDLDLPSVVMDLACRSSHPKCVEAMREELHLWLQEHNVTSDPSFALQTAVAHFGNDTLWAHLFDQMSDNRTKRSRRFLLAEALTSFTSGPLIAKTIDVMAFDPRIDLELAKFMFRRLSAKPEAVRHLWKYTTNHWHSLMNRLEAQKDPSIGISTFCDKLKTTEFLGDFVRLTSQSPCQRVCDSELHGRDPELHRVGFQVRRETLPVVGELPLQLFDEELMGQLGNKGLCGDVPCDICHFSRNGTNPIRDINSNTNDSTTCFFHQPIRDTLSLSDFCYLFHECKFFLFDDCGGHRKDIGK